MLPDCVHAIWVTILDARWGYLGKFYQNGSLTTDSLKVFHTWHATSPWQQLLQSGSMIWKHKNKGKEKIGGLDERSRCFLRPVQHWHFKASISVVPAHVDTRPRIVPLPNYQKQVQGTTHLSTLQQNSSALMEIAFHIAIFTRRLSLSKKRVERDK